MKKMMLVLMMMSLVATGALAESESSSTVFGARAGYSISPDQLFIGGQVDLGVLVGPMRLVPNLEIGFGGDVTTIAVNGDLIYDFPDTPWGVGGELGFIHTSWDDNGLNDIPGVDVDTSSSDFGLSVLGEYRFDMSGNALFAQGKLGLANSPDFKILVGMNF